MNVHFIKIIIYRFAYRGNRSGGLQLPSEKPSDSLLASAAVSLSLLVVTSSTWVFFDVVALDFPLSFFDFSLIWMLEIQAFFFFTLL